MSETLRVVKIGGNVIDSPESLSLFLSKFSRLEGPKILVHGGGKEATRLSGQLGIETRMIEGRRVTDRATIDIVTMVYAGLINKRIVASLQAAGCNAIGLCGADADVIRATMRPKKPIDYGFVGDIDPQAVNTRFLDILMTDGITPVICAIMHDGAGNLLNCNADSVANAVAVAFAWQDPVELIYCFEKEGVLSDPEDPASVIPAIDHANYVSLKADGVVSGGMIPKIDNAFSAIKRGVKSVKITAWDKFDQECGTTVKA